jgi:hypothetical protein
MITALVLAERGPEALATTLGALVPAVVEGLVGDAVVITRQASAEVANVAEFAGAALVLASADADPWRAGAARARRPWLLCLAGGDIPGDGWMRSVDRFLIAATRHAHVLGRFSRPVELRTLVPGIAERWTGVDTARAGDLAHRRWLEAEPRARVRPVRIEATIERDALR